MMLAELNGFNYSPTLERDIYLLVSQPTYRRHLSILKRGESIHQKERNTLTKCHSALIKVHSAPKLQHMFNKGKHFSTKLHFFSFFLFFLWESELVGCEKVLGNPSPIISHDISFLKKVPHGSCLRARCQWHADSAWTSERWPSKSSKIAPDKCGLQMFPLFGKYGRRHARWRDGGMEADLRTARGHEYFTCSMCEAISTLEEVQSIHHLSCQKIIIKKRKSSCSKLCKLF